LLIITLFVLITMATFGKKSNMALLHHINLNIRHREYWRDFWVNTMGCVANPVGCQELDNTGGLKQVHVNMGASQIHALHREFNGTDLTEQVLDGSIWLLCDSLRSLRQRLKSSEKLSQESCFRVLEDTKNRISLRDIYDNVVWVEEVMCPERLCMLSDLEGGSNHMVGLKEVNINVRPGSARGLKHFYQDILGCEVHVNGGTIDVMSDGSTGFTQRVRFVETPKALPPDAYETIERAGYHIAIYLNDFKEAFRRAQSQGLI